MAREQRSRRFRFGRFYSPGMVMALVVQFPVALYCFWWLGVRGLIRPIYWLWAALLRRVLLNLPNAMRSALMGASVERELRFFKMGEDGSVARSYRDSRLGYGMTTGVCEVGDRLYIEHLNGRSRIGYLKRAG